jgi:hypothetical protein
VVVGKAGAGVEGRVAAQLTHLVVGPHLLGALLVSPHGIGVGELGGLRMVSVCEGARGVLGRRDRRAGPVLQMERVRWLSTPMERVRWLSTPSREPATGADGEAARKIAVQAVLKPEARAGASQQTQMVVRAPELHGALAHKAGGHGKAKDQSIKGRALAAWQHFKHEMQHYWYGTKLLGKEVSICYGIVKQITRGEELTRREYRQLRTTSADLLKMIPMAVFILVPFMEFALPIALYLFPGILPSTFKHEWKKEDELKRSLKARIEVARFLQDAMNDMAHQVVKKYPKKQVGDAGAGGEAGNNVEMEAAEFQHFMKRLQLGDARVGNAQILKFCKLFTDDITLDNVGRLQLVNLCRLLDIPVAPPACVCACERGVRRTWTCSTASPPTTSCASLAQSGRPQSAARSQPHACVVPHAHHACAEAVWQVPGLSVCKGGRLSEGRRA